MGFKKKAIEVKRNLFKTVIEEDKKYIWDKKDGEKRKKIIETIGYEYKQINYLASVLFEIVKAFPKLQDNEIIKGAMQKFEEINKIRNEK